MAFPKEKAHLKKKLKKQKLKHIETSFEKEIILIKY